MASVLDKTFAYHPYIDVFRVISILTAVVVIVLLIRLTWNTGKRTTVSPKPGAPNPFDPTMVRALLTFMFLALVQETQQLGHAFVWWRLPLFLLGEAWALQGIAKRL